MTVYVAYLFVLFHCLRSTFSLTEMLWTNEGKMNVRMIVRHTTKHLEHWRIIYPDNCCSQIDVWSMNMDLYRCDNSRSRRCESNQRKKWLDALSNLSMSIEYVHWLVNELNRYQMAPLNEYWRRNLPVEACDEGHSFWNDFHQEIFPHNRSLQKDLSQSMMIVHLSDLLYSTEST